MAAAQLARRQLAAGQPEQWQGQAGACPPLATTIAFSRANFTPSTASALRNAPGRLDMLPEAPLSPTGRNFNAYPKMTAPSAKPVTQESSKVWEDLRREARKLESELDAKIAAYGKLCSGYEYSYSKGESGLAQDQLLTTKSGEIEKLLARLSDVNDAMRSALSGTADSRSHTLARHRDILHDFTQEFRRLTAIIGAARDRADLLGGSQTSPLLAGQSSTGLLLRERGMLSSANAALDDVMGQAQGVSSSLGQQRAIFEGIGGKMATLGARFPVVNSLLNAIRRKKSKDTIILSGVVAVCTLFILIYWWRK